MNLIATFLVSIKEGFVQRSHNTREEGSMSFTIHIIISAIIIAPTILVIANLIRSGLDTDEPTPLPHSTGKYTNYLL